MEEPYPFSRDDIIEFVPKSRTFNMSKHMLLAMCNFYEKHRENKNYDMAMKLLNIKYSIDQSFECKLASNATLAEIADIQISTE